MGVFVGEGTNPPVPLLATKLMLGSTQIIFHGCRQRAEKVPSERFMDALIYRRNYQRTFRSRHQWALTVAVPTKVLYRQILDYISNNLSLKPQICRFSEIWPK